MLENGGGAAAAAPEGLIKETTTQGFMKDVIEESKRQPVLIDFWAPWCGPCKQLTPILEKVVKGAKGKVKLVKMNIDEHPAIPGQMGIQSIPAVIAFVNGQPADGFMGALPESQVNGLHRAADQGRGRRRDQGSASPRPTRRWPRATPKARPRSIPKSWPRTRPTSPALAGLARAYVATKRDREGEADPHPGAGGQAQRRGRRRRARRARSRRAGELGRADRRARAEGRGQSARPSGALRSCGRAQRRRQAPGGGRSV